MTAFLYGGNDAFYCLIEFAVFHVVSVLSLSSNILRYKLNDVTQIAIKRVADLDQDFRVHVFVMSHFRNGGSADAGYGKQVFFLQVFVN